MNKDNKLNKKTILLLCLALFQVFIVVLNGLFGTILRRLSDQPKPFAVTTFSLVGGIIVGVGTIFLVVEIVRLGSKEMEYEVEKVRMVENRTLVDVLRSNRHDFSNHLQVILGYIQLKKSDMAVHYIKEITGRLGGQTSISNIKDMGVAALLLKKENLAESRGLQLNINIETDLSDLTVPSSDLIRILGNLIDNALDAVGKVPSNPPVNVFIRKERSVFKFTVSNREPLIPPEVKDRVFDKGFTTKGEDGSGLGLYIVRELVQKNGGTAELISNGEHGTKFTVTLPANNLVVPDLN